MPEFAVSVYDYADNDNPVHLFDEGPFFVERKANDVASKLTKKHYAPNIIAVLRVSDDTKGYPKLYRMGRLHRQ